LRRPVIEKTRDRRRHLFNVNLKQFQQNVVGRRAHNVAPRTEFADSTSEWRAHIHKPAMERGKIIRSKPKMMNRTLTEITGLLVVEMQTALPDSQKGVLSSTEITFVEDLSSERFHVPFDRRLQILCE
jgi:hypothetical protein